MVAVVSGWVVVEQRRAPDGRSQVVLEGPRGRRRTFLLEPWAATPDAVAQLAASLDAYGRRYQA